VARVLLVVAVIAAATAVSAQPAPGDLRLKVYFTHGQDVWPYQRQVSERTIRSAVAELLKAPTAAEKADGSRSWIPPGTKLNGVEVRGGVAFVDLDRRFLAGTKVDPLRARLVQLVYTATQFPAARAMRLLIDGTPAVSMGQGISVSRKLTRANVNRPEKDLFPPISYGTDKAGPDTAKTQRLQEKLISLGYLPRGSATGHYGAMTTNAVLAFQGWEGLDRDGSAGPKTYARVAKAARPRPSPGSGRRLEVYLRSQVVLLVGARNQVLRALHVSSGKPTTPTPPGSFKIFRKVLKDWSYPFNVWLPYASYFNGGIAFHEAPDVPPYPASHGCVRVPRDDAPTVYRFATIGTPVKVLG
jgi:hypothetical protein